MRSVARVKAQAKINVFLHIGGRQPSGYHDLHTLFVLLDLADEVEVRLRDRPGFGFGCGGDPWVTRGLKNGPGNIIETAANAYMERAGWNPAIHIEVTKHIPVGAGLGGGSSDAAAILRALNALNPRPLEASVLVELGDRLGSDVSFFLSGSAAAIGTGRGEKLLPLAPFPEKPVVLVFPPFGISTVEAYRWLDEDRPNALLPTPESWPVSVGSHSAWSVLAADHLRGNDFEPVVEKRHGRLGALRQELEHMGASIARLSGSGSTVFGIFEHRPTIQDEMHDGTRMIDTWTSDRVVQVEVLQ